MVFQRAMSNLNGDILKYISGCDRINTLRLAEHFKEDHQKIIGAVKSIQAHGDLLISTPITEKKLELTDEGNLIATEGY